MWGTVGMSGTGGMAGTVRENVKIIMEIKGMINWRYEE